MIAKCVDGPCAGEEHPLPDDAKIGHIVRRAEPFDHYDPMAPVYHPFSQKALDTVVQRFATYVYTADGLKHVP